MPAERPLLLDRAVHANTDANRITDTDRDANTITITITITNNDGRHAIAVSNRIGISDTIAVSNGIGISEPSSDRFRNPDARTDRRGLRLGASRTANCGAESNRRKWRSAAGPAMPRRAELQPMFQWVTTFLPGVDINVSMRRYS